jgi:hypothetical protein
MSSIISFLKKKYKMLRLQRSFHRSLQHSKLSYISLATCNRFLATTTILFASKKTDKPKVSFKKTKFSSKLKKFKLKTHKGAAQRWKLKPVGFVRRKSKRSHLRRKLTSKRFAV